ncbi:cytochrome P450 [Macrophomina phaseolina]|uniref:Cytochrome P450 n=1 Tax=Macrophomina phaseolina TaxID=35725 RepID=A0ABQ8G7S8_9PEZI|nr:cytochrome P450 [Macrophomina phaseolina]
MSTQRIMLPPKYIDEIKNHNGLDFHGYVAKEFFASYPGFDAFSASVNQTIFQDAVRTQLTQALALTIGPMAKEAPNSMTKVFGDSTEWKEAAFVPNALKIISRLITLIFLGEEFMDNQEWQRISVMYTVDAFFAAKKLNTFPAVLRPVVHWFLPECRKIREEIKLCRELITPEVERRLAEIEKNGGKPRKKVLDSIDWFVAAAKGQPFDYPNAELSLAMASIHTTTNTFSFAFFDLLENPQYVQPLREEIIQVFSEVGKWDKSTLFKLRFMDSFLKESMRYHPHSAFHLPRMATKTFTLSDGSVIPKDAYVSVGPTLMQDPNVWPNAHVFDPYRFLKLRNQPGNENKYQFVTTSCESTVFGHGHHSCPGRFFASNEIKLLLAHMIMYYDWKLPEGQDSVVHNSIGTSHSPNSKQAVLLRRRTPEIDFQAVYNNE